MKQFTLLLLVVLLSSAISRAQHWKALPFQFDKSALTCIPDAETDSMYIIGFESVNGVSANVVKWDGDTGITYQSILGGGNYLDDITTYQGKMFVAAGGILQRKDDTGWYWTNDPRFDQAYKFFRVGNRLAVMMEHLDLAANSYSYHLSVWNGVVWKDTLGTDTVYGAHFPFLSSIEYYKGQLYLASSRTVIRFDGMKWSNAGGGINTGGAGYIAKVIVWRGELYACGSFFESEGAPGNDIARWDGTSWHRLGEGLLSDYGYGAQDMLIYNNELYVVGDFSQAGGLNADGLAKWDGRRWCVVNDDFGSAAPAQIFEFKGSMFVSGRWYAINGLPYNHIAKWVGGAFGDDCSAPLSVHSPLPSASAIIYPNPASDFVFIGLTDVEAVSIYDMQGKLVSKTGSYVSSKGIDVSKLAIGLYMLRIETNSGTIMQRLVRE